MLQCLLCAPWRRPWSVAVDHQALALFGEIQKAEPSPHDRRHHVQVARAPTIRWPLATDLASGHEAIGIGAGHSIVGSCRQLAIAIG